MPSFAFMKRRKRSMLALAGLALLVGAGIFVINRSRTSLADFVDQDLRKLDDNPPTGFAKLLGRVLPEYSLSRRARLDRLLERILPVEFGRKRRKFFGYQPWYLWRVKGLNSSRLILFQARPLLMIPGGSEAAVHFLDSNGMYEGHSEFSTGWRIDIVDAVLVDHKLLGASVIEVQTAPSIGGASIGRQYYGIFENRVALLRIEDVDGSLVSNSYWYPNHQLGPDPPKRTEEEWEKLLLSSEHIQVLEALTWIGGHHRLDPAADPREVATEPDETARLVAAVRKRPAVQKRIGELTASENQWVREAAVLALKQLSIKDEP